MDANRKVPKITFPWKDTGQWAPKKIMSVLKDSHVKMHFPADINRSVQNCSGIVMFSFYGNCVRGELLQLTHLNVYLYFGLFFN